MLEVGSWIPVTASAEREAGCWMLDAGSWKLVMSDE